MGEGGRSEASENGEWRVVSGEELADVIREPLGKNPLRLGSGQANRLTNDEFWVSSASRWNMTCEGVVYADIEEAEFGTLSPEPVRS